MATTHQHIEATEAAVEHEWTADEIAEYNAYLDSQQEDSYSDELREVYNDEQEAAMQEHLRRTGICPW